MLIQQTDSTRQAITLFNLGLEKYGTSDIKQIQSCVNVKADGLFGLQSYNAMYNDLINPIAVDFQDYIKQSNDKKQIVWHHAAGWDNARGMFAGWNKDNRPGVGTAVGINDNGDLYRGFDEQYWGGAIGCSADVFKKHGVDLIFSNKGEVLNNRLLDMHAVAVEICNWGCLTIKDGKYYSYVNVELPADKVCLVDYRSFKAYEVYTDAEIAKLKLWTLMNAIRFDIDLMYSEDDMWQVSKKALSGTNGLYTHGSYRWDKNDVSPQPKLIDMAKSLELYQK